MTFESQHIIAPGWSPGCTGIPAVDMTYAIAYADFSNESGRTACVTCFNDVARILDFPVFSLNEAFKNENEIYHFGQKG